MFDFAPFLLFHTELVCTQEYILSCSLNIQVRVVFRRTAVLTTFATHLTQIVTLMMTSLWKNESLFMTTILGRTRITSALTYTIRLHYQIVISDAEFMYNFMLIRKSRVDCGCPQVVASQRGDARPKR